MDISIVLLKLTRLFNISSSFQWTANGKKAKKKPKSKKKSAVQPSDSEAEISHHSELEDGKLTLFIHCFQIYIL